MSRPKDIYGNDIEMGPWYWAKNRIGQICGVGKFAVNIGSDDVVWFTNGTGYSPDNFQFVKSIELPDVDLRFRMHGLQPSEVAVEIAARIWCDQEMHNCVMDVEAATAIAWIIDDVRHEQSIKQSYSDLAASGGLVNAP